MWRNDTKCKYMFMFPLKNLARKGLSFGMWCVLYKTFDGILHIIVMISSLAPLVPPQPSCCPSKPSGDAANDNISYLGAPKCLNNDGVFIHPSVAFTKASSEGVVVSDVTGSSLPASRHGNTPQILRNPEDTLPQPPQPLPSTGLSGVDSENIHFQHPHPPSYSHPHPPPSPPSDLYLTIE